MTKQRIWDISPPITDALKVWPGDTPPSREVLMDMKRGDSLTLSTLRTTVHVGAHADGPNHCGADAPGIDARPLDDYLGPCQVVSARATAGERVRRADIDASITRPRVLIRTGTHPDPTRENTEFAALDPDLVEAMHAEGVRTIGIDTPSVDLFTSVDLESHNVFLARDMAILEGLVLTDVPDGEYELIALPLRLIGFDASPVRAVLRELT